MSINYQVKYLSTYIIIILITILAQSFLSKTKLLLCKLLRQKELTLWYLWWVDTVLCAATITMSETKPQTTPVYKYYFAPVCCM